MSRRDSVAHGPWRTVSWHSASIVDRDGRQVAAAVTTQLRDLIIASVNAQSSALVALRRARTICDTVDAIETVEIIDAAIAEIEKVTT